MSDGDRPLPLLYSVFGLRSSNPRPHSTSNTDLAVSFDFVQGDVHNNPARAAMTAETSTPQVPTATVLAPLDLPNELPPLLVTTVPLLSTTTRATLMLPTLLENDRRLSHPLYCS
jgi:hypothetical protein